MQTIITDVEALKMPIKTKNFNPESDTKLLCSCGHTECDKRSVQQWVLNVIQMIRDDANRPLKITSGGRCPKHPNEVHREKPADHQKCQAVDVAVYNGEQRAEIVMLALKHGANAIGIDQHFIHVGFRGETDKVVMWTY